MTGSDRFRIYSAQDVIGVEWAGTLKNILAIASGALASGLGYALWYAALPSLRATTAGIVQLSVPVIAAVGGVLLLAEPLSLRLVVSGLAVLGGIALALRKPARRQP